MKKQKKKNEEENIKKEIDFVGNSLHGIIMFLLNLANENNMLPELYSLNFVIDSVIY